MSSWPRSELVVGMRFCNGIKSLPISKHRKRSEVILLIDLLTLAAHVRTTIEGESF